MMTYNACKSCGVKLIWIVNKSGKNEPFDAKPARALIRDGYKGFRLRPNKPELQIAGNMVVAAHLPHFVTCPDSGRWKKGKKA